MITGDFTLAECHALEEICQDRFEYLTDKVFASTGKSTRYLQRL